MSTDSEQTVYQDEQSQSVGGSSAAERLGGPSEVERASVEDRDRGTGEDMTSEPADRDTTTGATAETGATGAGVDTKAGTNGDVKATLIAPDRAESYRTRWTELKGDFVDEPRRAVRGANELVGEVLDQLEELFRKQRSDIERDLDSNDATTEDLRLALGKYRSFFDRLLSI